MKTHLLLATLLVGAFAPVAAANGDVTVHLTVDTVLGAPTLASCDVSVPAGSNVEAVLNQAVADGCIVQWSCSVAFSSPGNCFVDMIDGILAPGLPTWWAFRVDGEFATQGVSTTIVGPGASYRFSLDQSVVFPSPI